MELEQAWQALFEGKIDKAKELVAKVELESSSLRNLLVYLALEEGDFLAARRLCDKNLQEARTQEDTEAIHMALHQKAMVEREDGRFREALNLIEEEAVLLQEHFPEDSLKLSVNFYEQGYLRLKLSCEQDALSYMEKSLALAEQTDDVIAQACSYRGLGEIYQALENTEKAQRAFSHALSLFEQAGDNIGAEEVKKLQEKSV